FVGIANVRVFPAIIEGGPKPAWKDATRVSTRRHGVTAKNVSPGTEVPVKFAVAFAPRLVNVIGALKLNLERAAERVYVPPCGRETLYVPFPIVVTEVVCEPLTLMVTPLNATPLAVTCPEMVTLVALVMANVLLVAVLSPLLRARNSKTPVV